MAYVSARDMSCCGIKEIHGIQDSASPQESIKLFLSTHKVFNRHSYNKISSLYVFSAVVKERGTANNYDGVAGLITDTTYGPKLAAYIRKNKLGEVVEGPARVNLNHRKHTIQAWFWSPNWKGLRKWHKDHSKLAD